MIKHVISYNICDGVEILGPIDEITSLIEMTSNMRHEKSVILGPFSMLIILKKWCLKRLTIIIISNW